MHQGHNRTHGVLPCTESKKDVEEDSKKRQKNGPNRRVGNIISNRGTNLAVGHNAQLRIAGVHECFAAGRGLVKPFYPFKNKQAKFFFYCRTRLLNAEVGRNDNLIAAP